MNITELRASRNGDRRGTASLTDAPADHPCHRLRPSGGTSAVGILGRANTKLQRAAVDLTHAPTGHPCPRLRLSGATSAMGIRGQANTKLPRTAADLASVRADRPGHRWMAERATSAMPRSVPIPNRRDDCGRCDRLPAPLAMESHGAEPAAALQLLLDYNAKKCFVFGGRSAT